MKIGIIGAGFVGEALVYGLCHRGFSEIFLYDPFKYPNKKITSLKKCDIVFVCVPTPMGKNGFMDDKILRLSFNSLKDMGYKGICILKSTTIPNIVHEIVQDYKSLRILTNPEFLTQRTANKDFLETKYVFLGGEKKDIEEVRSFFQKIHPGAVLKEVGHEAAMMAKYMTNSFFAVKVSLMNEFYHLWESLGYGSWEEVVDCFKEDTRVSPNHCEVPGPDGDFGFGGKCFSKDLNAVMALAALYRSPKNVMRGAWKSNSIFRQDKDWLNIEGAVSQDYNEKSD